MQQFNSRKVEVDTLEQGWKPRAAVTNSKETPLFICAAGHACWRLFPDKGKLLAHRAKDHATSQAGFWEETISWNSVMQQDKLEEVEAIAASVKQQDVPMEPEISSSNTLNSNTLAIDALGDSSTVSQAVEPIPASGLSANLPLTPHPASASTTELSVLPETLQDLAQPSLDLPESVHALSVPLDPASQLEHAHEGLGATQVEAVAILEPNEEQAKKQQQEEETHFAIPGLGFV